MSWVEDMGYDGWDWSDFCPQKPERIGSINIVENGYVVEKEYCLSCKSTNIKVSKKGNKYCGKICWEKK